MKFIIVAALIGAAAAFAPAQQGMPSTRAFSPAPLPMKVVSSIGALAKRSKTCQVIRRRGRYYVIDKKNPRNKARQGGAKMKAWMGKKKGK